MSDSDKEETVKINLTITASPSTPRIPIQLSKTATASDLRSLVAEATKIPLDSLRLIFRGRMISNDDENSVVEEFKLEEDCVLHCMGKPAESSAPAPAAVAATSASTAPAGPSVSMMMPPAAGPTPTTASDPLQHALMTLRSSNPPSVYLTAVTTLQKILNNIMSHPTEEKYRKVKKQNAAFQKRLGGLKGAEACMLAAGFTLQTLEGDGECYVLQASAEAWPRLVATKAAIDVAVQEANASQATAAPAPPVAPQAPPMAPGFGGSLPGFGGSMPGMPPLPPGMMTPELQQAAAAMASDPQAVQRMMTPELQQAAAAIASNPEAVQRMAQMMESDPRFAQNPMIQQRLQQLRQSGMMGGGMPGMMPPGAGTSTVPNANVADGNTNAQQSTTSNANSGGDQNDEEMTEEEMLQEAIRRSLEES